MRRGGLIEEEATGGFTLSDMVNPGRYFCIKGGYEYGQQEEMHPS